MGKKKSNGQHLQQSMGQMVSRAALAQLGPQIEDMVRAYVNNFGERLAHQQASTLETIFARVVVLESIVMDKLGYSSEQLTSMVADLQDEKEGFAKNEGEVILGDLTRIEISTKTKDQSDFQGSSRIKIYQTGSGQTIGKELEEAILGMKAGETKELNFGKDGAMVAKIKLDRVSRELAPVAEPQGESNASQDQSQG